MCPVTGEIFGFTIYSLEKGHSVVESKDHKRELKGQVVLTKPCPLTGDTNEE